MKYVAFSAALIAALSFSKCRRRASDSTTRDEDRQPQRAAADAATWIKRLDASGGSYRPYLDQLYQELPPLAEWPPVIQHLRRDDSEFKLKHRLFGELLENDEAAASTALRALLVNEGDELSKYDYEESVRYLYTLSRDPEETKAWIQKNIPALLTSKAEAGHGGRHAVEEGIPVEKADEAITELWKKVEEEESAKKKLEPLTKIAAIARLLDKKETADKAVARMAEISLTLNAEEISGVYDLEGTVEELGLRQDWKTLRRIANRHRMSRDDGPRGEFQAISLIATYHLEGPAALLNELKTLPNYGITDFEAYAGLLDDQASPGSGFLGEYIVRACHGAGDKETARITLSYLIAMNSGEDPLYRIAIELFPDAAPALFKSLIPYNPYQERPLIWLADLALRSGNPDQARTLINEAITLDPSDGEQGKHTRMQAYDVLSRILRAKGDNEKADFFARVTSSIRRGEVADDFLRAGLVEEAVRRYREALGEFGDAYCLQSRLAKTLLKQGRFDEAKVHFEKAFELMPVSFGPVESHCFGCEQIFEDDRVKEIALAVFRRMIAEKPQNPRTHYLLGLVLEEMKLRDEAILSFRKALELDPKYYNCATRLHEILSANPATLKDAGALLLKIAAIAPYPDIAGLFQKRTDLRQVWIDAQTPRASPLKLDPLPLPFIPQARPPKGGHGYTHTSDEIKAIDGWSTRELLEDNELLDWINGL